MKLPSVQSLWISLKRVVIRFPLQVLIAVTATIAWCWLIDPVRDDKVLEDGLTKFIAVANLALVLLLAADLYAEINQFNRIKKWSLRFLLVLVCIGLYLVLHPSLYEADVYRIVLLAFAFHLLVAFAPFTGKNNLNGFWQFNKSLFLRFLTSALYAAVLYGGLAIALVAINGLFNVDINDKIYLQLFALVTAGFMTIFFLAGVPEDFMSLNKEDAYPKGLKIFTQYVLIPLMTIYLLILLLYEVKIIVNWELPKGMVSTLILGYAIFGILSLLLIYPVKDKAGNDWIKLFSRFFYVMMIPLVVLLLLAVGKRVSNYGITESRYILMVLAVWLCLITVYFLLSKKQNIKVIPISLCIVALLATYGPQSAFSVSEYSQVNRLKRLMASKNKRDLLQRGPVVNYLVDRHGLHSLQRFSKVNLYDLEDRMEKNNKSRYNIKQDQIDTAYALLNIDEDSSKSSSRNITFQTPKNEPLTVKGYDFVIPVESYGDKTGYKANGVAIAIEKVNQYGNLKVKIGDEPEVELNIKNLIQHIETQLKTGKLKAVRDGETYYLPSEFLTVIHEFKYYEVKLMISYLVAPADAEDQEEVFTALNYRGYLLIKIK